MERWRKFQIKSREIWDVDLSYPGEGVGHEENLNILVLLSNLTNL